MKAISSNSIDVQYNVSNISKIYTLQVKSNYKIYKVFKVTI